jgi:hypothetical protein
MCHTVTMQNIVNFTEVMYSHDMMWLGVRSQAWRCQAKFGDKKPCLYGFGVRVLGHRIM